jgi:hypothetical protein
MVDIKLRDLEKVMHHAGALMDMGAEIERARCKLIVDQWCSQTFRMSQLPQLTDAEDQAISAMLNHILKEIEND